MKKLLLMIVAVVATLNVRATDITDGGFQYDVVDLSALTAKVVGFTGTETVITVPATVTYNNRTLSVIAIDEKAFQNNTNITSVTISEGISSIGDYAFDGCTKLSSVTISTTVTAIGAYTFQKCTALTEVTFTSPSSIASIGDYAFSNCTALTEVTLPSSITSIGNYTFSASGLTNVTIPKEVTIINSGTFSDCTNLTQVSMSNAVTIIDDYAFYGCSLLSDITLSNSLKTIGSYTFQNCTSLEINSLPESITSIGTYVFSGCSGIKTFILPDELTSIPSYCFYKCKNIEEVVLPSKLESIGSYAFNSCSSLKSIDIPRNVTNLSNYAFEGCTNLNVLKIGKGLEYVYDEIYQWSYTYYYPLLYKDGPSKMDSIIIKDGSTRFSVRGYGISNKSAGYPSFSNIDVNYYYVGRELYNIDNWTYLGYGFTITASQPYGTITTLEIGGYCTDVPYFYQSVENLILGEDVETFTVGNIYEDGLTAIYCRSTTPATISGTFENTTYMNVKVYVPVGSLETYKADDGWKTFWSIEELDEMPEGYVGSKIFQDETTGLYFLSDEEDKTVTLIPSQGDAYSGDIVIPETVNGYTVIAIDDNAFAGSDIESVEIPETVTEIGDNVFSSCSSLVSVTMDSATAPTLGNDVFDGISSNAILYVPSKSAYSSWSSYFASIIDGTESDEENSNTGSNTDPVDISSWILVFDAFDENWYSPWNSLMSEAGVLTHTTTVADLAILNDFEVEKFGGFNFSIWNCEPGATGNWTLTVIDATGTTTYFDESGTFEINDSNSGYIYLVGIYTSIMPYYESEWTASATDIIKGQVFVDNSINTNTGTGGNSAIEEIEASVDKVEISRYNLAGQRLTTPTKGINIIRYSDGTTQKVLVK